MSTAAYIDDARDMARRLERRMVARGYTVEGARCRVADNIGCSPGTLTSLSKSRLKRVEGWFSDRLRSLLIREYEKEIEALTHELSLLRQSGARPDCLEIQEIETCLDTARRMVAKANRSPLASSPRR